MNYSFYKILLIVLDYIVIRFSFFLSAQMTGVSRVNYNTFDMYVYSPEFLSFFLLSALGVFIFKVKNLYTINIVLSIMHQLILIFLSIFYTVIFLTFLAFFIRSAWIIDSRLFVVYFSMFSIAGVALYRICIFRPIFIMLNRKKIVNRKVVIVGSDIIAQSFAVEMSIDNLYGFELVGFVDDKYPFGKKIFRDKNILGEIRQIPQIVDRYGIDEIIVAESAVDYGELMRIIDIAKQTTAHVNVASQLFSIIHKKVSIDSYFEIPIAPIRKKNQNEYLWILKRIVDIVGATVGFLILLLPFILIAVIIKITSTGPVFYKQIRIGKDGKPFDFYKFRSMKVGSDKDDKRKEIMRDFIKGQAELNHGSTKIVNEDQVTKIGRFLRKTSLDELPQLFNVLKGEMSLVGPRPCLPYEYEAYDNWHKRRLSVLPGCTGLWQVSSRSETGFDEMVVLDLYYIGNVSLLLDFQLMFKTIPVMMFGKGGK